METLPRLRLALARGGRLTRINAVPARPVRRVSHAQPPKRARAGPQPARRLRAGGAPAANTCAPAASAAHTGGACSTAWLNTLAVALQRARPLRCFPYHCVALAYHPPTHPHDHACALARSHVHAAFAPEAVENVQSNWPACPLIELACLPTNRTHLASNWPACPLIGRTSHACAPRRLACSTLDRGARFAEINHQPRGRPRRRPGRGARQREGDQPG